jgi:colicin import membrane protein
MSMRAIPRAAIGGSIKVMRLPLDLAVSLMPGDGPRPSAGLALDRVEAHVRDIAGVALGDEVLREDAARRRVAADERERALRLRTAAQRRTSEAEERLADTHEVAEEQREQAAERARRQRVEADRQRKQRAQDAARVERARQSANKRARADADEAIDEQATAARLEHLEREAAVLDKQADALSADAEARRLQDAATRRKAARKNG